MTPIVCPSLPRTVSPSQVSSSINPPLLTHRLEPRRSDLFLTQLRSSSFARKLQMYVYGLYYHSCCPSDLQCNRIIVNFFLLDCFDYLLLSIEAGSFLEACWISTRRSARQPNAKCSKRLAFALVSLNKLYLHLCSRILSNLVYCPIEFTLTLGSIFSLSHWYWSCMTRMTCTLHRNELFVMCPYLVSLTCSNSTYK